MFPHPQVLSKLNLLFENPASTSNNDTSPFTELSSKLFCRFLNLDLIHTLNLDDLFKVGEIEVVDMSD